MFGILKRFGRRTVVQIDAPAETLRVIERAASAAGRSVEDFVRDAAVTRARAIT